MIAHLGTVSWVLPLVVARLDPLAILDGFHLHLKVASCSFLRRKSLPASGESVHLPLDQAALQPDLRSDGARQPEPLAGQGAQTTPRGSASSFSLVLNLPGMILVELLLRQFLFHSRKYIFIINGDGHVALVAVNVCFALRSPVDKVVIDPAAGFGTISGFPRRGTRVR